MKGKTWITLNRETLRELLEEHLHETLNVPHTLVEFTLKRNGSIECAVTPKQEAELPLEATGISQE